MRRLILLTVLIVAFCAMPAFASTQNVKVDGDLDSTLVIRNDFDLGLAVNGGFSQNLFITQARVGISADLTDNVGVKIKLINERPWTDGSSSNTDVDINEAYAIFREFIYSPATVSVGTQPLRFGNALIIGDPNTNNRVSLASGLSGVAADLSKEKAFDSVRLTLDYNPLTIDIFGAKINGNTLTGATSQDDDVDLLGWNNNYKFGDKHNTEAEVYFFAKRDLSTQESANGTDPDTVYVPGARVSTNVLGLNLQGEVAWQRGNKAATASAPDNQRREAMAAQIIASHQVAFEKTKKYNPVVALWGTYLSGDSNATAGSPTGPGTTGEKYTAWDPMFEDQAGGTIYNTLFDYSNVRLLGGSLSFNPMEDVLLKTTFTGLWLDKNLVDPTGIGTIAIRQPDGTSVTPALSGIDANSNQHLGNELDFDMVYNYSEDVQFGASAGWFFPGAIFQDHFAGADGNNDVATQFLLNADVAF